MDATITVRVRLYASLSRHLVKPAREVEVALPAESSIEDLLAKLGIPRDEVKIAYVQGRARPLSHALSDGDEIGVFPPIGGG